VRAPELEPARVPEPELVPALEPGRVRARAPGRVPELELGQSWGKERSGWVRHFHKLPLRGPRPPEMPLIAKSLER